MTTIARLTRALGALAALIGLLAGVPYLLAHIGTSPLRPAPNLGRALGDFVSGPIDDHAVLGLITVAVWALWAIFTICVTREIVYVARGADGGTTRPLRFTGPFQIVAHRLVASILLVGVATTAGAAPLSARPARATPVVVVEATPQTPAGPADFVTPTPPTPAPPATAAVPTDAHITVAAGDTPWDLAETHLGDGMRWQELWNLNSTRPQPDGRTWSDPHFLLPGWELGLPAAPATPARVAGTGQLVTVAPGDNAWDLAETHLGDGMRWQELWNLNSTRPQLDGRTWSDPETVAPGWTLELPTTDTPAGPTAAAPPASGPAVNAPVTAPVRDDPLPAPATAVEAEEPSDSPRVTDPSIPPAPPVPPSASAPAPPEAASPPATTPAAETVTPTTAAPARQPADPAPTSPDSTADETATTPVAVPVLGFASTVLAVAVLRSLRRRRTRRAARLPVAVMPPPPPRAARSAARELLAEADEVAVDRLDAALANLAAGLRPRGGESCVQPRLVQVTGTRIEVLLDRANPAPPAPWRPEASGQIWVLDPDVDLPATEAALPLPALVTLGVGTSDILVDLEAYGVVSLTGDIDACWALARSMVTEISARAEGTIGIEVIGQGLQDHVADLEGVEVIDGWDDVDTGIIAGSARMLGAGRWPHTFAARASGRVFDGWTPAVWICTPSDHPRYQTIVDEVGRRPGAGSAIVVAGGNDIGHGLRIDLAADGTFHIPELGLGGQAQQLTAQTVEHLVDLLEDADDTALAQTFPFAAPPSRSSGPVDDPVVEGTGHASVLAAPQPQVLSEERGRYEDPDYQVLVRVCGEIHVEGGKEALPPRESAVATYIALHHEVDLDQVRDAVWGGTDVSRKRVRNVVSSVRRSLGEAVSFVDEGRVRAGHQVATDIDLIRRRLAYAHHQTDARARAETLHGALDWVSGKVCSYPSSARRSWTWIDLDNWISNVESLVGTVAHDLANLYLDLGDTTGAAWAARRGIDATGPREQLTLLLVKSYEFAGDEPAAASALRSYERYMADLGADEHSERLLAAMDRHLPTRARHAG